MHRLYRGVAALLSAAMLVGVGLAQTPGGPAAQFRELFLQLDANQDGAIAKEEVPPSALPAFERLLRRGDSNHNGKLEADEYRSVLLDLRDFAARTKEQAVRKFQTLDKDGDGKVSRDEFTGPKPRFEQLDRNGDGFLTQQEFLGGAAAKAKAKAAPKKKANAAKESD
ncbi:MAG TPA: EF-hand domain-containing protein [Isosphaeraceae bacterium]|nr:EF-hand domain-containing protein [Isosphaeraceae bacterium]